MLSAANVEEVQGRTEQWPDMEGWSNKANLLQGIAMMPEEAYAEARLSEELGALVPHAGACSEVEGICAGRGGHVPSLPRRCDTGRAPSDGSRT
jgi:hypothetical protein